MYLHSIFLMIFVFIGIAYTEIPRPRGVAISKSLLYQIGKTFTCLDGSATIPYDRVNDDYCDCADSSDEPGTSACPNGFYHCTNAGHRPLNIQSSRVNDGICDCCDGTDEYSEIVQCQNICREMGRRAREEAEKAKVVLREGHTIYLEYSKAGKEAKSQKRTRLTEVEHLKNELKAKKDELDVVKQEAELPEKEAKTKFEEAWQEEKKKLDEQKEQQKIQSAFEELDKNNDQMVDVAELKLHKEFDIDSNGEVSDEEAKEYLEDMASVNRELFFTKLWPAIKDIYKVPVSEEITTDQPSEGGAQEQAQEAEAQKPTVPVPDSPEAVDEGDEYEVPPEDEDEEHDDKGDTNQEQTTEEPKMPDYDEDTRRLIENADIARKNYDEAESRFREVDTEFNEINGFLSMDLGLNDEFFSIKDQCFEYTTNEYVYKLCPYSKTTQRGKDGGVETSLGNWGFFDGGEGPKKYTVMKFEKGQNCWNGPDRSTKVILSCGSVNELKGASEPNRCEYEFLFTTPAVCSQLPASIADDHDEL